MAGQGEERVKGESGKAGKELRKERAECQYFDFAFVSFTSLSKIKKNIRDRPIALVQVISFTWKPAVLLVSVEKILICILQLRY